MKRRNLLVTIAAIVMMLAIVSCSESVAPEDKLGTITFGENTSRAVGTVVKYSNEVEDMYWYYKATKKDDGYTTGDTAGKLVPVAVNTEKQPLQGLSGKTLNNNFSYGLWDIELMGFKATTDVVDGEAKKEGGGVQYKATITGLLVNKDANYATAKIVLGENPETLIVFDSTNGIYFSSSNITADSVFSLAVTDNKGTVTVTTTDGVNDVKVENGKVTFYDLTYALNKNEDIIGNHTMNFVLTQTLSGEGNTTINAALYTLKFSVEPGTTTTISGELLKNDETGTVQINSVQDVPELTLIKVMPVDNVDTTNKIAKVSAETVINYGDLEVTYPEGAVISTSTGSVSEDNKTSDAKIGFEYKETATETDIEIEATEAKMTFELTLSASTSTEDGKKNTKLITIKKFIGKGLTISKIYHAGTEVKAEDSANLPGDGKEGYYYDDNGYLTLYVLHASEFNIITKEAVATVGDTKYYSFDEAIANVSENGTVTLLCPITLSKDITPSKSFTLDMNGKVVTPADKAIKVETGTITVSGSVSADQKEFIHGVNNSEFGINGTYSPRVAQIGDKYYASLESAIKAAEEGSTVTLLRETTLTKTVTASKSITLDLDRKAVTVSENVYIIVGAGTLTVTNKAETQADFVVGIAGENGTYTAGVARIGITCYSTFEAAVDAVKNNEEIVLLQDVTYQGEGFDKNLTIDFNNRKLTLTAELSIKKPSSDNASCPKVTFKNGKLYGENLINTSPVISVNEGTLDIQNMKINLVSKNEFGIYVDASFDTDEVSNLSIANSEISVEGGNNNVSQGAILVGNNDGMYYGDVNITNSTITVSGGANLYGIYASRSDACNTFNFVIENTDVTGVKGGLIVWAKSEQVISISNSTFTGEKYGAYFDGGKINLTKSEFNGQYGLFVYGKENDTNITFSEVKLVSSSDMRLILTANSTSQIVVDGSMSADSVKKYVIQKGNTIVNEGDFSEKLTITNVE